MSTNQSKKANDDYYREKYIMGLIDGHDCEAAALLSKTAAEHTFPMMDICVIYNIFQCANEKSGANYPLIKIIGVIDVTLENAARADVPPVELSKIIVGTLFNIKCSRQTLNEIERDTKETAKSNRRMRNV